MDQANTAAREIGPKPAEAQPAPPAAESKKGGSRRVVMLGILAAALIAGGIYGWRTIRFYERHAETDDAQIEAHIDPVLPKVSGYVREVRVNDNQKVAAGDVLLTIDDRDYASRVATAQADLQNARAAVAVAKSEVQAAETTRAKTAADLARYATLRQKEEVSQQQYDAARAAADAAVAQVEAEQGQVSAAAAKVLQKQADLELARLQESYVTVTAPANGVVSRKNVEVGQFVQAGQPLLAIVSDAQRLGGRELQGDAAEEDARRDRRSRSRSTRTRSTSFAGRVRVVRGRDRREVLAAAAGQRHRQLHQGGPARAGEDRSRPTRPIRRGRCAPE